MLPLSFFGLSFCQSAEEGVIPLGVGALEWLSEEARLRGGLKLGVLVAPTAVFPARWGGRAPRLLAPAYFPGVSGEPAVAGVETVGVEEALSTGLPGWAAWLAEQSLLVYDFPDNPPLLLPPGTSREAADAAADGHAHRGENPLERLVREVWSADDAGDRGGGVVGRSWVEEAVRKLVKRKEGKVGGGGGGDGGGDRVVVLGGGRLRHCAALARALVDARIPMPRYPLAVARVSKRRPAGASDATTLTPATFLSRAPALVSSLGGENAVALQSYIRAKGIRASTFRITYSIHSPPRVVSIAGKTPLPHPQPSLRTSTTHSPTSKPTPPHTTQTTLDLSDLSSFFHDPSSPHAPLAGKKKTARWGRGAGEGGGGGGGGGIGGGSASAFSLLPREQAKLDEAAVPRSDQVLASTVTPSAVVAPTKALEILTTALSRSFGVVVHALEGDFVRDRMDRWWLIGIRAASYTTPTPFSRLSSPPSTHSLTLVATKPKRVPEGRACAFCGARYAPKAKIRGFGTGVILGISHHSTPDPAPNSPTPQPTIPPPKSSTDARRSSVDSGRSSVDSGRRGGSGKVRRPSVSLAVAVATAGEKEGGGAASVRSIPHLLAESTVLSSARRSEEGGEGEEGDGVDEFEKRLKQLHDKGASVAIRSRRPSRAASALGRSQEEIEEESHMTLVARLDEGDRTVGVKEEEEDWEQWDVHGKRSPPPTAASPSARAARARGRLRASIAKAKTVSPTLAEVATDLSRPSSASGVRGDVAFDAFLPDEAAHTHAHPHAHTQLMHSVPEVAMFRSALKHLPDISSFTPQQEPVDPSTQQTALATPSDFKAELDHSLQRIHERTAASNATLTRALERAIRKRQQETDDAVGVDGDKEREMDEDIGWIRKRTTKVDKRARGRPMSAQVGGRRRKQALKRPKSATRMRKGEKMGASLTFGEIGLDEEGSEMSLLMEEVEREEVEEREEEEGMHHTHHEGSVWGFTMTPHQMDDVAATLRSINSLPGFLRHATRPGRFRGAARYQAMPVCRACAAIHAAVRRLRFAASEAADVMGVPTTYPHPNAPRRTAVAVLDRGVSIAAAAVAARAAKLEEAKEKEGEHGESGKEEDAVERMKKGMGEEVRSLTPPPRIQHIHLRGHLKKRAKEGTTKKKKRQRRSSLPELRRLAWKKLPPQMRAKDLLPTVLFPDEEEEEEFEAESEEESGDEAEEKEDREVRVGEGGEKRKKGGDRLRERLTTATAVRALQRERNVTTVAEQVRRGEVDHATAAAGVRAARLWQGSRALPPRWKKAITYAMREGVIRKYVYGVGGERGRGKGKGKAGRKRRASTGVSVLEAIHDGALGPLATPGAFLPQWTGPGATTRLVRVPLQDLPRHIQTFQIVIAFHAIKGLPPPWMLPRADAAKGETYVLLYRLLHTWHRVPVQLVHTTTTTSSSSSSSSTTTKGHNLTHSFSFSELEQEEPKSSSSASSQPGTFAPVAQLRMHIVAAAPWSLLETFSSCDVPIRLVRQRSVVVASDHGVARWVKLPSGRIVDSVVRAKRLKEARKAAEGGAGGDGGDGLFVDVSSRHKGHAPPITKQRNDLSVSVHSDHESSSTFLSSAVPREWKNVVVWQRTEAAGFLRLGKALVSAVRGKRPSRRPVNVSLTLRGAAPARRKAHTGAWQGWQSMHTMSRSPTLQLPGSAAPGHFSVHCVVGLIPSSPAVDVLAGVDTVYTSDGRIFWPHEALVAPFPLPSDWLQTLTHRERVDKFAQTIGVGPSIPLPTTSPPPHPRPPSPHLPPTSSTSLLSTTTSLVLPTSSSTADFAAPPPSPSTRSPSPSTIAPIASSTSSLPPPPPPTPTRPSPFQFTTPTLEPPSLPSVSPSPLDDAPSPLFLPPLTPPLPDGGFGRAAILEPTATMLWNGLLETGSFDTAAAVARLRADAALTHSSLHSVLTLTFLRLCAQRAGFSSLYSAAHEVSAFGAQILVYAVQPSAVIGELWAIEAGLKVARIRKLEERRQERVGAIESTFLSRFTSTPPKPASTKKGVTFAKSSATPTPSSSSSTSTSTSPDRGVRANAASEWMRRRHLAIHAPDKGESGDEGEKASLRLESSKSAGEGPGFRVHGPETDIIAMTPHPSLFDHHQRLSPGKEGEEEEEEEEVVHGVDEGGMGDDMELSDDTHVGEEDDEGEGEGEGEVVVRRKEVKKKDKESGKKKWLVLKQEMKRGAFSGSGQARDIPAFWRLAARWLYPLWLPGPIREKSFAAVKSAILEMVRSRGGGARTALRRAMKLRQLEAAAPHHGLWKRLWHESSHNDGATGVTSGGGKATITSAFPLPSSSPPPSIRRASLNTRQYTSRLLSTTPTSRQPPPITTPSILPPGPPSKKDARALTVSVPKTPSAGPPSISLATFGRLASAGASPSPARLASQTSVDLDAAEILHSVSSNAFSSALRRLHDAGGADDAIKALLSFPPHSGCPYMMPWGTVDAAKAVMEEAKGELSASFGTTPTHGEDGGDEGMKKGGEELDDVESEWRKAIAEISDGPVPTNPRAKEIVGDDFGLQINSSSRALSPAATPSSRASTPKFAPATPMSQRSTSSRRELQPKPLPTSEESDPLHWCRFLERIADSRGRSLDHKSASSKRVPSSASHFIFPSTTLTTSPYTPPSLPASTSTTPVPLPARHPLQLFYGGIHARALSHKGVWSWAKAEDPLRWASARRQLRQDWWRHVGNGGPFPAHIDFHTVRQHMSESTRGEMRDGLLKEAEERAREAPPHVVPFRWTLGIAPDSEARFWRRERMFRWLFDRADAAKSGWADAIELFETLQEAAFQYQSWADCGWNIEEEGDGGEGDGGWEGGRKPRPPAPPPLRSNAPSTWFRRRRQKVLQEMCGFERRAQFVATWLLQDASLQSLFQRSRHTGRSPLSREAFVAIAHTAWAAVSEPGHPLAQPVLGWERGNCGLVFCADRYPCRQLYEDLAFAAHQLYDQFQSHASSSTPTSPPSSTPPLPTSSPPPLLTLPAKKPTTTKPSALVTPSPVDAPFTTPSTTPPVELSEKKKFDPEVVPTPSDATPRTTPPRRRTLLDPPSTSPTKKERHKKTRRKKKKGLRKKKEAKRQEKMAKALMQGRSVIPGAEPRAVPIEVAWDAPRKRPDHWGVPTESAFPFPLGSPKGLDRAAQDVATTTLDTDLRDLRTAVRRRLAKEHLIFHKEKKPSKKMKREEGKVRRQRPATARRRASSSASSSRRKRPFSASTTRQTPNPNPLSTPLLPQHHHHKLPKPKDPAAFPTAPPHPRRPPSSTTSLPAIEKPARKKD